MPDLPDLTPMETLGRLAETALLIDREKLTPVVGSFGLQSGEFDVLAALRRAGGDFTLTPTQLFETTMMSSGGMTARLDRLEKAGWVKRRANPNDRRGTLVGLTEPGKALIERALVAHLANETSLLAALSDAEISALNAILRKLLKAIESETPKPG
jgi:DNA-binding MarR family transcriptional regulator